MPMPQPFARLAALAAQWRWWVALGTLSSLGLVLCSSAIASKPEPASFHWWLRLPATSYGTAHVVFYLCMAGLTISWLGVGALAAVGELSLRRALSVFGTWATPLFLGVPLFSRDLYSYVAQSEIASRGLNPYRVAPDSVLHGPALTSIASVWHHTTSPYGPLFVQFSRLLVKLTGNSYTAQILVLRAAELPGIVLLVVAVVLLTRRLATDSGIALWLVLLSPAALVTEVASAHNDTLMLGLMLLGVAIYPRYARWGLVLVGLAACIKISALVVLVFLVAGALGQLTTRARVRAIAEVVAIPASVIVILTQISGYGWTWLSPSTLKIPTELRILITPVVSLGTLLASMLHAVGLHVPTSLVITVTQEVSELAAVLFVLWLVRHTKVTNTVTMIGAALLIIVVASPVVWPWYCFWGLSALAVTSMQRSKFLALLAAGTPLLVGAGGTMMIGGNGFYVVGPLIIGALIWFFMSHGPRRILERVDQLTHAD